MEEARSEEVRRSRGEVGELWARTVNLLKRCEGVKGWGTVAEKGEESRGGGQKGKKL